MKGRNQVVGLVFWGVALVMAASLNPTEIGAQGPSRVGLVVGMGDGAVVTRCVEFAEKEVSGYDLLVRSGLQVVVGQASGIGVTICGIAGEGCPANDCFCECSGSSCTYWSYWHLEGGEWTYSSMGASLYKVRSGYVDGWAWSEGDPPPVVPFEQICVPPATATPTPSATPTDTPLPPPSVRFEVDRGMIVAGECAQLRWQVEHVQAVYLGGQGIGGHGERDVCPTQTQTYELRVVSAGGESRHSVTVNVVQTSPTPLPTSTSTLPPAATAPLTNTPLPADTATATPTAAATSTPIPPTASPTSPPAPAPTGTFTKAASTVTPSPTLQSVAVQRATPLTMPTKGTPRLSPTLEPRQATPTMSPEAREKRSNYILFGVLLAILVGVIVAIVIQRKR